MGHYRPTLALINLSALAGNLKTIRGCIPPSVKILAVVKANGYGHGAVACAKVLEQSVEWFGVATVEEGAELRAGGIRVPILVLGGTPSGAEEAVLQGGLTATVYDLAQARALSQAAVKLKRTVSIHIKIDTGMTRLGVCPEGVGDFMTQLSKLAGLKIEGIFSHLAQADLANPEVTEAQEKHFRELALKYPQLLAHLANSAATVTLGAMGCGMVRPGLMLYGATPNDRLQNTIALQPVMTLKTEIVSVREVRKGQGVSYGWTFVTKRTSRIATLPIGYADGYPRSLSNRASVVLHGKRAPVVGAVCMDLMMVDVTDIPEAVVGDPVTLIGRDGAGQVRVEELALLAGSIPYEILCGLSARVPRIYEEGR